MTNQTPDEPTGGHPPPFPPPPGGPSGPPPGPQPGWSGGPPPPGFPPPAGGPPPGWSGDPRTGSTPYGYPTDQGWSSNAPPPPPSPYPPYAATPPPAERVRMAWQGRAHSDYVFDFWTALGWSVLTFGLFGFYVFYQLVRRLRDHNARRLELLDGAVAFAWAEAGRQGLQEELTPSFQRAAAHLAVVRKMTSDFRDPAIWVVLSLIGGVIVHVVAFILLDQDLVTHDRAEIGVEYELALVYGRLGQPLPYPDPHRLKGQHNYVGRIVATVFSFGIYFLWWFHDMMAEPNRHFEINWAQEDALAVAVQALQ